MSFGVSGTTIINQVLRGSNCEAKPRWTQGTGPTLLLNYINASLTELDDQIILKKNDFNFVSEQLSWAINETEKPLPALYYKMRNFYYLDGGQKYPIFNYELATESQLSNSGFVGKPLTSPLVQYVIVGNYIRLQPTLKQTLATVLEYVRTTPQFSAPTDALNFINGWHRYVIADVTATVIAIEGLDPSFWLGKKNEALATILDAAASRNDKDAPKMVYYPDDQFYWQPRQ